jgi:hypothetical protein
VDSNASRRLAMVLRSRRSLSETALVSWVLFWTYVEFDPLFFTIALAAVTALLPALQIGGGGITFVIVNTPLTHWGYLLIHTCSQMANSVFVSSWSSCSHFPIFRRFKLELRPRSLTYLPPVMPSKLDSLIFCSPSTADYHPLAQSQFHPGPMIRHMLDIHSVHDPRKPLWTRRQKLLALFPSWVEGLQRFKSTHPRPSPRGFTSTDHLLYRRSFQVDIILGSQRGHSGRLGDTANDHNRPSLISASGG